MNGKVHVAIGTGSLAMFCLGFPDGFDFMGAHVVPQIGLATVAFGSLLPDIDLQRSSMGHKHSFTSKVVSKAGGGHRGITHTLLFCALLTLLQYFIAAYYTQYELIFRVVFAVIAGFTLKAAVDVVSGHNIHIPWIFIVGAVIIILLLTLFGSNTRGMLNFIFSSMFGISFGYIAHIAADLFNGKGTPFLWPLSQSKISIMDLPSEGEIPWVFTVVILTAELFLVKGKEIICWITYLIQLISQRLG